MSCSNTSNSSKEFIRAWVCMGVLEVLVFRNSWSSFHLRTCHRDPQMCIQRRQRGTPIEGHIHVASINRMKLIQTQRMSILADFFSILWAEGCTNLVVFTWGSVIIDLDFSTPEQMNESHPYNESINLPYGDYYI